LGIENKYCKKVSPFGRKPINVKQFQMKTNIIKEKSFDLAKEIVYNCQKLYLLD